MATDPPYASLGNDPPDRRVGAWPSDALPSGALQNAAALMLLLDDTEAAAVMAQLSLPEASQLRQALARVAPAHELVTSVRPASSTAAAQIGRPNAVNEGKSGPSHSRLLAESSHYVRGLLRQAFATPDSTQASAWPGAGGHAKGSPAARFDTPETGIERLRRTDLGVAAQVIAAEHPQVAAVALSILGTDFAARLLQMLPPRLRGDLCLRLATLGPVSAAALQDLQEGLLEAVQQREARRLGPQGGIQQAAQILNRVGAPFEAGVLEAIRTQNADVAERLAERMAQAAAARGSSVPSSTDRVPS